MKRLFYKLSVPIIILAIFSCKEIQDVEHGPLCLTGIGYAKGTSVITLNLDSGLMVNSTPIAGYMPGATLYDPSTGGYGYIGLDSVFRLINPETGVLIKNIKLPGCVLMAVIDPQDNMLIGFYTSVTYENDPDTAGTKSMTDGSPVYTNYVIRASLSTEDVVSQKVVDIGNGVNLSCYYFDQRDKRYMMLRDDMYLIAVNPSTGVIEKEVYVGKQLTNAVYSPDKNNIISLTYSLESDRNYIVVTDAGTGKELSSKMVEKETGYLLCVSGFDKVNNWYMTENGAHEIVFYDVLTGETVKRFKPDFPLSEMKLWREYTYL